VENSLDYSLEGSVTGTTGGEVTVECASGFFGGGVAKCGTDGTFNKLTCCRRCVPFDASNDEWGKTSNVNCVLGSPHSGCDCSVDGGQYEGQECHMALGKPEFSYNRVNGLDACNLTTTDIDVCMTDTNDINTDTDLTALGTVYPASWKGESSLTKIQQKPGTSDLNHCRVNVLQFSVLQTPLDPTKAIKSLSHDHCWLQEKKADGTSNLANASFDTAYKNTWGHGQEWTQTNEFDNSKMVWIGVLLGSLCGIMAYIDFLSTFVPKAHPLAIRCNVPEILAKLVTKLVCPCTKTYPWHHFVKEPEDKKAAKEKQNKKDEQLKKEEEQEQVRNWTYTKEESSNEDPSNEDPSNEDPSEETSNMPMDDCGGRCNSERCAKRKSEWRSDEGGEVQGNLVYLLLVLPFNFMIACYTVVGENFVNPTSGDVSGGMWALGSVVAIDMM
jgi:hypothetical protein